MADTTLTLILRLRDETRGALTKLRQEVASLQTQGERNFSALSAKGKQTAASLGEIATAANMAGQKLEAAGRAVATLTVAFTGIQVVQWLKGFADAAARAEVLDTVLKNVAVNSGVTEAYISKLDSSVQALGITAAASRQALTQFLQSGLDITKAEKLARASQDLAVIAGTDSSTVFQRMITNIQQLDTVGLRWMGIIVSQEEAAAKYAASIGKTADELTRAERQQALMNAVLEKSVPLTGVYEKAMGDVGKQLTSLVRLQNDVARNIGNVLLPTYSMLVEEFTVFLKNIGVMTAAYAANRDGAKQLAESIKPVVTAFRAVAEFVVNHIEGIATLLKLFIGFRVVAGIFHQGREAVTMFRDSMILLQKAHEFLQMENLIAKFAWFKSVVMMVTSTITTVFIPAVLSAARAVGTLTLAMVRNPLTAVLVGLAALFGAAYYLKMQNDEKLRAEEEKRLQEQGQATDKQVGLITKERDAHELMVERRAQNLARLQAMSAQAIRDNEEELEITRQMNEARKSNDLKELEVAKAKMEAFKKDAKARREEREELTKLEGITPEQQAALDLAAKKQTAYLANQKAVDELKTAMTELGIESQNTARYLDLPKDFIKQLGLVDTVIAGLRKQLRESPADFALLATSFGQASAAAEQLVEKANTFDAFQAAMKRLTQLGNIQFSARNAELFDTAAVKAQESAMADLNKVMYGFITRNKEAAEAAALLRQVSYDAQKYVTDIKSMIVEYGAGLTVAENGIISINKYAQTAGGNRAAMLKIEQQQMQQQLSLINSRYTAEQEQIDDILRKKKELILSEENLKVARYNLEAVSERDTYREKVREENLMVDKTLKSTVSLFDASIQKQISLGASSEEVAAKMNKVATEVKEFANQINNGGITTYDAFNASKFAVQEVSTEANLANNSLTQFAVTADNVSDVLMRMTTEQQAVVASTKQTMEQGGSTATSFLEEVYASSMKIVDATKQLYNISLTPQLTASLQEEERISKVAGERIATVKREASVKVQAAEYEAQQKRLESTRKLYSDLQQMEETYKGKLKESMQKIAELTKEINNVEKSQKDYKFEQSLKSMTEYEQKLARQSQLEKTIQESREAAAKKNSELARSSAAEAVQLAKALVDTASTELERKDALEEVDKAYENQKTILSGLREEERKAQQQQVETLNMLTTAMDGLREKFSFLTEARKVQLKVDFVGADGSDPVDAFMNRVNVLKKVDLELLVNDANLQSVRQRIQQGLSGIPITMNIGPGAGTGAEGGKIIGGGGQVMIVNRFAQGGMVGRGTDSGNDAVIRTLDRGQTVFNSWVKKYATGGKTDNVVNLSSVRNFLKNVSQSYAVGGVVSSGGRISGPGTGTSDNVPAMLSDGSPILVSNGEWIIREKAVKFYGDAFLSKLNALQLPKSALPKFSEGGKVTNSVNVTVPALRDAAGSQFRDHVSVDINVGGQKSTLFGERKQVDQFVNALRRTG